jgi:hypothetical protein
MNYNVNVSAQNEYTYKIEITVTDDNGSPLIMGETTVIADSEQQARDYAENIYMPDLKRNNMRLLSDLVLECEQTETPADGGAENAEPTAPETI